MRSETTQFTVAWANLGGVVWGWALGLLAASAFAVASVSAQTPLSNVVFTVGTTVHDASGNDWSYLFLGSPQPELLAGKKFAVYGKPGQPTNGGAFTLRGNAFQQTDVNAISNLLVESVSLGQNLSALQGSLIGLLARRYPATSNQNVSQNVLSALQLSAIYADVAESVRLVAGANPGLSLCLGQAFTEKITSVTTYEVREVNLATQSAGDVVGRVTITPGAPTILPAPGAPFQVITNSPFDDLRIRLRWGEPDALLRLSFLSYGYDVWRIPKAPAELSGYNTTPPTTTQLSNDVNFIRANMGPVMATKYFPATGANDSTDGTTYFFADGHQFASTNFMDGDQFYYFITARDLLGRDGFVSPGTLMEACSHITPDPPTKVRVLNIIQPTNQQRLAITWLQNTNPTDHVTEYWIYRWPNPAMLFTNDTAPTTNRIGVVPQASGTNGNMFVDGGADAPLVPGVTNFWYSVRAVNESACGPLFSSPTPPAWGVLRERAGPAATTGTITGSCGAPVVMYQSQDVQPNAAGPDTNNWDYRLTCVRRDPGIAWVQFTVSNYATIDTIGPVYFPPGENTAQMDYAVPVNGTNFTVAVTCIVGNYYNATSAAPALHSFTSPTVSGQRQEAVFYSGQLLGTALSASDPLLTAFLGAPPHFFSAITATATPSGTVAVTLLAPPGAPVIMQVFTNSTWHDLGIYMPDTNNVYWISYPACLLGPVPPFQGAYVPLPGDCGEHIARGADGSPVAPVHLSFSLTPRTREYRLYRTLDGGPLSLFAQGRAAFDSNNPNAQITRTDDGMPASLTHIGYFVQVLDQNGHGSPISLMGFRRIKPPKPPRPVLAQPTAAGDTNNPQVTLSWFCPPAGVYRFSVKIARNDQAGSGKPSGIFSQKLLALTTYNPKSVYLGLTSKRLEAIRFDEVQLSPPIGTNFGPGPAFSLNVSLTPNVPYALSVAAEDDQGGEGDASQAWNFTWVPPIPPEQVPWPARPFVPTNQFDDAGGRVKAVLMMPNNEVDVTYPVGIRIGSLQTVSNVNYSLTAGSTNFFTYSTLFSLPPDPSAIIFKRQSSDPTKNGDALLPIVIYRQQLANTTYPHVSGHITQVSPLIEKLPIAQTSFRGLITYEVPDLLIGSYLEPPGNPYLYLRDQQPVMNGAKYQYYVVRFNAKHEVSEVIDAGQVQLP